MIDLNEMTIFATVVEAGSFTNAGKMLGLPKSTVSRKIALLEERLGVLLLQRTTRSLKLTNTGEGYYQQCARIVSQAKEADITATEQQDNPVGLIRITAAPGFMFLADYLADFMKQYDQIQVELNLDKRVVDMVSEGYDFAFRVGPLETSSLIARLLGTSKVLLCASPLYLNQYGWPPTFEELKKHKLIQGIPWQVVDEPGWLPSGLSKRISTNENEIARKLALKGLGIALLSETDCIQELKDHLLEPVLSDHPFPEKNIYLVYPSKRYLSLKLTKFIEYVLDRWKTDPPW